MCSYEQQEKAARKAAKFKTKKQQSLQEFLNSPGEVDPAPEEKISAEIETNAEVEAAETEGESGAQTLKSEERETEVNSSGNDSQHIPTERSDPAEISNSSSEEQNIDPATGECNSCLLYTSPSPRDKRQSRMPSSA